MNIRSFRPSILSVFAFCLGLFACSDDDNNDVPPISKGTSVTINNTFQSTAFGIPDETPIEVIFDVPAESLYATATVSAGLEFDNYLLNLYDVDIDESSINFVMSAEEGDPTYGENFRTIEAGTTDRYYLNFDSPHNVSSFSSDNPSVSLRIDSDTQLVVEISEGFNFRPGQAVFTITLQ